MPLEITDRLKRGDVLHMQIENGDRYYWFENPHQEVSPSDFDNANDEISLTESGDSLFGFRDNSQTWIAAMEGTQ